MIDARLRRRTNSARLASVLTQQICPDSPFHLDLASPQPSVQDLRLGRAEQNKILVVALD